MPDPSASSGQVPTISCCIVTYNEEKNIKDCLESVSWVDEIIVVDSHSTDKTREIAKKYTDKVILNKWPGYVAQKNFALEKATKEWILCLDADERCTKELKKKIIKILQNADADGFYIKRHVFYLGKWINHCGWYPDYKVRLVRRGKAKWDGIDPHDKLVVNGKTARLKNEIVHLTYKSFAHQIKIINRFSDVVRDEWIKTGKKPGLFLMLTHPVVKFFEVYIAKMGFLDGLQGLIISIASSFYVFSKYVKLWEHYYDENSSCNLRV